jgi:hypothetical protein
LCRQTKGRIGKRGAHWCKKRAVYLDRKRRRYVEDDRETFNGDFKGVGMEDCNYFEDGRKMGNTGFGPVQWWMCVSIMDYILMGIM